mgnify:CR=1 FL=1
MKLYIVETTVLIEIKSTGESGTRTHGYITVANTKDEAIRKVKGKINDKIIDMHPIELNEVEGYKIIVKNK